MTVISESNIDYSPKRDPQRQFDFYSPPAPTRSIVVFVHGGAWRAEDKADHAALAQSLCKHTQLAVAVPNYRLTPSNPQAGDDVFRHPGHAEDLLHFLEFLIQWPGPDGITGVGGGTRRLYLIGHSCSAHMLASIFLDSSKVTPSLGPSATLLEAVKAIVMSEGIYDIPLLLSSFPAYLGWFIANTFGQHDSYDQFSTTHLPLRSSDIRWYIIHSKDDTLVDEIQSQKMYDRLHTLLGSKAAEGVSKNMDQITGDHNAIFKGDAYVRTVGDYITRMDSN